MNIYMVYYKYKDNNDTFNLAIEEENVTKALVKAKKMLADNGFKNINDNDITIELGHLYNVLCFPYGYDISRGFQTMLVTVGALNEEEAKANAVELLKTKGYKDACLAMDLGSGIVTLKKD